MFENLIRYRPSGTYFGRVRVNGKLIRRSLETHVLSVAKVKLSDFLQDYRRLAINKGQSVKGEVIIEIFRKETEDDANNQPRTKLYTAKFVDRRRVKPKELHLPSQAQFQEMATHIETSGAGQAKDCANLFRFLAFSGVRIDEARHVLWSDLDFEKGLLHVRVTKNSKARWIPLNSSLRQLLEKMRREQQGELPDKPVMQVFECQKSIDRAAKLAGVRRITHHDLRHLFATRCIESGVDIPTVSRWLGHQDGGALCMKTYGHLRDEHSQAQALKVEF